MFFFFAPGVWGGIFVTCFCFYKEIDRVRTFVSQGISHFGSHFQDRPLSTLRPKLYNVYLYPSYNHTVSGMNINQKGLNCNYIPYMGAVLCTGKREAPSLSLHLFEATSGQARADSSNWALSLMWANTAMRSTPCNARDFSLMWANMAMGSIPSNVRVVQNAEP